MRRLPRQRLFALVMAAGMILAVILSERSLLGLDPAPEPDRDSLMELEDLVRKHPYHLPRNSARQALRAESELTRLHS